MILFIGGMGQGKLDVALNYKNGKVFDGKKDDILKINDYDIINKFNFVIKRLMENGSDIEKFVDNIENEIVICDEVGNGVVPIDKFETDYRENVGRACCKLAKKSEKVIRVFCGMEQIIK
ncbi:MAG: bifunctional adenosylcobinamide kinase/adenosylcobinamide-phosphate guanylyltransferase [Lachnospirales bacterium]